MANELGNQNVQNGFTEASKEELPLEDILDEIKEEATNVSEEKKAATVDNTAPKEKELSPLEKMAINKNQTGVVVSNQALTDGEIKAPIAVSPMQEKRTVDLQGQLDEMDETIKKRNAITVINKPMDQVDYIQMIEEIEAVDFDANGKAFLPERVDVHGEPLEYKFIRLRKDGEPIYDRKFDNELKANAGITEDGQVIENHETNSDEEPVVEEKSEEMKKVVEVLIDKTGLGVDFAFSNEEKEKIEESELIRLKEVKLIDIKTLKVKRSDKSFQENVKAYSTRGERVSMCFPASGFKAEMKGMTYGEYADVALDTSAATFDQYYKRLSIIYNNMTNISTGPFKDFEDFLKNFAYTDIPLAIYGMYIATEQDEGAIRLNCGACSKGFDWNFQPRSLLRLDRCADNFLVKMQSIANAAAATYDSVKGESAVQNSKLVELPDSKFVVELGIASAYDFLYNLIPLSDEKTYTDAFGNVSSVYAENIVLLTAVRSVYIPTGDGEYEQYFGYKDILESIYNIKPMDIKLINAYAAKYLQLYETVFSLGDTTCPHCGQVTKNLDVNIDDLVFRTYLRLSNIDVDLTKLQDL